MDGQGAVLCPGLVDMRVEIGEPGYEYRETIASATRAASAGGITTIAVLPTCKPAIDNPALVRMLRARGEETGAVTILPYGALTKGCEGKELAEIGLLHEAGAVAFTDGNRAIDLPALCGLLWPMPAGLTPWWCSTPKTHPLPGQAVPPLAHWPPALGLRAFPQRPNRS